MNTSKNQIPSITSSSNALGTNPEEIFELLSGLDIKKTVGFDMAPPKFVKIAASVLCQPLLTEINNSFSQKAYSQANLKLQWFATRQRYF